MFDRAAGPGMGFLDQKELAHEFMRFNHPEVSGRWANRRRRVCGRQRTVSGVQTGRVWPGSHGTSPSAPTLREFDSGLNRPRVDIPGIKGVA